MEAAKCSQQIRLLLQRRSAIRRFTPGPVTPITHCSAPASLGTRTGHDQGQALHPFRRKVGHMLTGNHPAHARAQLHAELPRTLRASISPRASLAHIRAAIKGRHGRPRDGRRGFMSQVDRPHASRHIKPTSADYQSAPRENLAGTRHDHFIGPVNQLSPSPITSSLAGCCCVRCSWYRHLADRLTDQHPEHPG